jgi:antitoxin component of MazEF toxin-antitoxin module
MKSQVILVGDELAVVLPQEIVEALNLQEGSPVSVVLTQDRRYAVISTGDDPAEGVDIAYARQVAEFIGRYRLALLSLHNHPDKDKA